MAVGGGGGGGGGMADKREGTCRGGRIGSHGGCVGVTNTPHMRVLSVCDSIAHLQVQSH